MGKPLYRPIHTCVLNNGWISETFPNTHGIRQGCPLIALLFVLSIEIMAIRLTSNKDIKTFNIKVDQKTHTFKISQLADNTTLFISSRRNIYISMNEIDFFFFLSGLTINRNKTEGLWI